MKRTITCLSALALFAFGALGQEPSTTQPVPAAEEPMVVPTEVTAPQPALEIITTDVAISAPAPSADLPAPAAPATQPAAAETPAPDTAVTVSAETEAVAGTPDSAADGQTDKVDVLPLWEMIVFCVVVVGVIGLGIWKSGEPNETAEEKKEEGAADYFLAGRGLSWWLVGFSLLAANISTEQFVGMSGQAADWLGLAIAGYEWLAAIVLVIVAFSFLPMLLKRGVFTIPQFLEERYNGVARVTMAIANLLILVGVPTAAVIYAGSTVISVYFDLSVTTGCIIIAVCATVYVYVGGLKACAWTDLIWGSGLIAGGALVAYYALTYLGNLDPQTSHDMVDSATITATELAKGDIAGSLQSTGSALCDGISRLWTLNDGEASSSVNGIAGKLHMMRPANDPVLPWTVYLLGLWIPNFFYWGLNQYIMQRTLASKSLEEGQLGVVFAAFLKLLIPFVVITPGILAYNLFRNDLKDIADARAATIVQTAEASADQEGKKVIYNLSSARLIRADVAAESIALLNRNADAVGATAEQKAELAAAADALNAIHASDTVARSEAAQKLIEVDAAITGAARANTEQYAVTTALVGYHYDSAFATLLKRLLPGTGWAWFVLAALFGAVVSSLASMFNSASTLFTIDIYGKTKEVCGSPATQEQLVSVGRWAVIGCALIATVLAPYLDNPAFGGIFTFIQEFQGFLSPGVLAVFLFGFFVPKCPRIFGWLGIAIGAALFGILKVIPTGDSEFMSMLLGSFLNRMAICFVFVCLVGLVMTLVNAARGGEAVILEDKGIIEMKTSPRAKIFGTLVVIATITLYIVFW